MKKLLLTFFLLFTLQLTFAQRDTEHWFAPFYNTTSAYVFALYMSTDSTTPFKVDIYNNNAVIGSVNIAKGAPQTFTVTPNLIYGTNPGDAFQINNKGIYLKGEKPFFATLRATNLTQHGEIITSKGKAGIGYKFYAGATPISINTEDTSTLNFTGGIMATEDNTTVTITWNAAGITFIGAGGITGNTKTVTLNKGQSFILAGTGKINVSRFIGTKIVADKPVTVTNGNSNGNFGTGGSSGSDMVMDQNVPVERLGNTFAMVKSLSTAPAQNMEGAIVVATENNTQIFVNGGTTPLATIGEGEWYRIDEVNYVAQGTNGHKNMFISTSKNVCVYQLIGRDTNATCGYNFIPPLSCFLPKKIDEIGKINEMPNITLAITLKLNILTEAGASILVNGVAPTAAQGPYPLTGNSQWETYAITGITGNVTVQSTKAVTVGVNGGFSTAGYGGYFAGFSSVPLISKQTGTCVPGIVLEVDDSYDSYQWYRNGNLITGATNNSYTPTLAGNYTVRITMGSCTPVTTPVYKVFTCLQETTHAQTVCEGQTAIIPAFTSSSQTVANGSVVIITPPLHGTATVSSSGTIAYTANNGYFGPDTLVYKFCGDDPEFTDCEQVTLNLTISKNPVVNDVAISTCYLNDNNATGLFNLTTLTVTTEPGVTKEYYPSPTDAANSTNAITNPANYIAPTGVAFIKVISAAGCYSIAKVTLTVWPPTTSSILKDKQICIEKTTTLDAGPGFTSYEWSTGETSQSISNVTVGSYWVKLKTGECFTKQEVKVYPYELPVITGIEVSNNTVTVNVIGGHAPYQYSIDNHNWQDSNVFENITRGDITVYVKDSNRCKEISISILIPQIINVITPNGDGLNDSIDYSALSGLPNLTFSVYDRYGSKIHEGNKDNGYKWDGTINGKAIPTGNYWYDIRWDDINSKAAVKYSGWILVKNR